MRLQLSAALVVALGTVGEPTQAARIERLAFTTGAGAGQPSVTVDPRGGFILTWQERSSANASLWHATFDRNGRELRRARIAAGETWFVNWADFPSLAVLANGDWVTHFLEKSAGSTYSYDIRIVRSTDRGATWSKPVTPHTDGTASEHGFVTLVPLDAGRVLVAWLDGRNSASHGGGHGHGGPMTLRSAILDRTGTLSEQRELDESTCDCCQTDGVRVGKRTRIAYRDRSAGEIRDITVIDRADEGTWSKPRSVNADGWKIEGCPVNGPAIAASGSRLLKVWPTQAGGASEVRYATGPWNETGTVRTLASGAGTLGRVDAAAWGDGFLATWLGGAGPKAGLQVAEIDGAGTVVARQTVASVAPTRVSGNPRLASNGERALLAWVEPDPAKDGNIVAIALLTREGQR